jgi:hypothetical protein
MYISLDWKHSFDLYKPDEHGDDMIGANVAFEPVLRQRHLGEELHYPRHLATQTSCAGSLKCFSKNKFKTSKI